MINNIMTQNIENGVWIAMEALEAF